MTPEAEPKLTFENLALACVGALFANQPAAGQESKGLHWLWTAFIGNGSASEAAERLRDCADGQDALLLGAAKKFGLTTAELAAVALCAGVDDSLWTARLVAWAQHGGSGTRPLMGLLAQSLGALGEKQGMTVFELAKGAAFGCGLLTFTSEAEALPQRPVAVPLPVAQALAGHDSDWPGCVELPAFTMSRPAGLTAEAEKHAKVLAGAGALVVRASSPDEARIAVDAILEQLAQIEGMETRAPVFMTPEAPLPGLAVWLWLKTVVPVFLLDVPPGETRQVPEIPGHTGPVLVITGMEGGVTAPARGVIEWRIAAPCAAEREALWKELLPADAAADFARKYRMGAARIAQVWRQAGMFATMAGRPAPAADDVTAAMRSGEGSALGALAQRVAGDVPGDAFIRAADLREQLSALLARCKFRDGIATGLGPSAQARFSAGVRALFTGPSGTGKTLAAGWLATKLGLPLYRVDLAAISSKYIGETERNLARLFAAAEHTAAVLLFDEADSLFGKRTDIRDSTDRFANAQTNYLLQRIETFDGIALLTSNSRAHFDAAFARRLDVVVEFPAPGHAERRELWRAHLGDTLGKDELALLAEHSDLAGGQIRNVVFAAAVEARGAISLLHILNALVADYRKSGRTAPREFLDVLKPKAPA